MNKRATFEDLIEGKVSTVSLLNEPVIDEPKESATARALRIWFRHDPTVEGKAHER